MTKWRVELRHTDRLKIFNYLKEHLVDMGDGYWAYKDYMDEMTALEQIRTELNMPDVTYVHLKGIRYREFGSIKNMPLNGPKKQKQAEQAELAPEAAPVEVPSMFIPTGAAPAVDEANRALIFATLTRIERMVTEILDYLTSTQPRN